jgi:MFS family permease
MALPELPVERGIDAMGIKRYAAAIVSVKSQELASRKTYSLLSVMANMGHGINDMYFFIFPLVLPLMLEQFDLVYTEAGGLLSAFLFVIAGLSLVMGRLSDRFSPPLIIGVGFLMAALCMVGAGFAGSFTLFIVFLLLVGVGVSTYHPSAYGLLHKRIRTGLGRSFGHFEFWGLATLFSLVFVTGTLLRIVNWQNVVLFISAPGFVAGFLFLYHRKRLVGIGSSDIGPSHAPQVSRKSDQRPQPPPRFLISFVLACFSSLFVFLTFIGVMNFMPTFFVRAVGLSPTLASYTAGFFLLGGMISAPFAGRFLDRRNPFLAYTGSFLLVGPLVFALGLPIPYWLMPVILMLLGACSGAYTPARNMVFVYLGSKWGSGQIFGIVMGIAGITNSMSPLLFGLIADIGGLRASMRFFAIPALLGLAVSLVIGFLQKGSTFVVERD